MIRANPDNLRIGGVVILMKRFVFLALLMLSLSAAAPTYALDIASKVCDTVTMENLKPSQECLDLMAAYPKPIVTQIPLDSQTISSYNYWHVKKDVVNLYASPGGAIVRQLEKGFNFVVAVDTSMDGWIQVQGGEWMSKNDATSYEPSYYRGVTLLNQLQRPFGWAMDTMLTVNHPGGKQVKGEGQLLKRYDLVNIFATVAVDGWNWYMVGPDQWIDQRVMAVAKPTQRPEGVSGRWVAVDLYEQTLVAYENDTPVFATLVSSGLKGWDTNEGIFKVWAKVARDGMSGATGAPDSYALQSVPWVMYFDKSISLHGTYWHDGFGYRHSHGCVNLSISDAHFIFSWMSQAQPDPNGDVINKVYVYSTGKYGSAPHN
jgi:hypothetical protein